MDPRTPAGGTSLAATIADAVIGGLVQVMKDIQNHSTLDRGYAARIAKLEALAKALRGE